MLRKVVDFRSKVRIETFGNEVLLLDIIEIVKACALHIHMEFIHLCALLFSH